jgi:hypothetical protein
MTVQFFCNSEAADVDERMERLKDGGRVSINDIECFGRISTATEVGQSACPT